MPHIITKPSVVICGSRSIPALNLSLYISPSTLGSVISGGAIGIDTIARNWAMYNKIEYIEYLPNWEKFGNRAGFIRNKEMIDACDEVIAFWDGKSKGTLDSITYAEKTNHKCTVHLIQDLD